MEDTQSVAEEMDGAARELGSKAGAQEVRKDFRSPWAEAATQEKIALRMAQDGVAAVGFEQPGFPAEKGASVGVFPSRRGALPEKLEQDRQINPVGAGAQKPAGQAMMEGKIPKITPAVFAGGPRGNQVLFELVGESSTTPEGDPGQRNYVVQ